MIGSQCYGIGIFLGYFSYQINYISETGVSYELYTIDLILVIYFYLLFTLYLFLLFYIGYFYLLLFCYFYLCYFYLCHFYFYYNKSFDALSSSTRVFTLKTRFSVTWFNGLELLALLLCNHQNLLSPYLSLYNYIYLQIMKYSKARLLAIC